MYTLGSYFSQGVYAVAGPFQGAVDIVVVKQEDGTFKSSPWYVKCGDPQGSRQEPKVEISVNEVKADFCMILNRKGEAFFEREVEDAILALPSPSALPERKEGSSESFPLPETKDESSGLLSFQAEDSSRMEDIVSRHADANAVANASLSDKSRETSTGDAMESISSTVEETIHVLNSTPDRGGLPSSSLSLASSSSSSSFDYRSMVVGDIGEIKTSATCLEASKKVLSFHSDANSISSDPAERNKRNENELVATMEENYGLQNYVPFDSDESSSSSSSDDSETKEMVLDAVKEIKDLGFELDEISSSSSSDDNETKKVVLDAGKETKDLGSVNEDTLEEIRGSFSSDSDASVNVQDLAINQMENLIHDLSKPSAPLYTSISDTGEAASYDHVPSLVDVSYSDSKKEKSLQVGCDDPLPITTNGKPNSLEVPSRGFQVEFMAVGQLADTCGHLDGPNVVVAEDWFSIEKVENSEQGHALLDVQHLGGPTSNDCGVTIAQKELHMDSCLKNAVESSSSYRVSGVRVNGDTGKCISRDVEEHSKSMGHDTLDKGVIEAERGGSLTGSRKDTGISMQSIAQPESRWNIWPLLRFRRSRSKSSKVSLSGNGTKNEALLVATNIALGSPSNQEVQKKKGHERPQKRKVRTIFPTSKQIESLQLKEGPNKVTFTFPGTTQVDAYIYLWKWNARIVISDVDGTITKSDVLGQVMPLVGRDWSQSGVTRLFTAIKENGYEVLFLSARAISQAYLTRRFLGSLKQDGETLPEGPVFISPDGLLPSLYREVIRRTPHEFKISCLEEIRKLFPRDVNPFYAGFGNRHTDELSYRKVGIPKGKIFIINPKGEVMVNQHHHINTYTSIHALVDGMFPPFSRSEQEDFNSWNYWKLPLPNLGDELTANSSKAKRAGNR